MKTHGKSKDKLYRVWNGMKQRCYNANDDFYYCYGAKGITVCEEWKNSFQNFYDWAISHGYDEKLSIDRIDVNGNYCPEIVGGQIAVFKAEIVQIEKDIFMTDKSYC